MLQAHRDLGSEVVEEIELPDDLPTLVGSTVYRVVAEGMANASKHGLEGNPVRVVVRSQEGASVEVMISNAVRPGLARPSRGGGAVSVG